MIVFTLWTNNAMPPCYQQSIEALRAVYPDLVIRDAGDKIDDSHAGWVTDRERIRVLAEEYTGEDVLYLDADCVAYEPIKPGIFKKPAFPNIAGGNLDYWAMFKPAGCEGFFFGLLSNGQWDKWAWVQYAINRQHRGACEAISGYPEHKYLSHLHLSHQNKGFVCQKKLN